jgi:signal peptidase I
MNLHQIVSGVVGAVNPFTPATLYPSLSHTTNPDGSQTPGYAAAQAINAQVQQLNTFNLRQLEGLNLQGVTHKIYFNGQAMGVERVASKGGDLIVLNDGRVWLVVTVFEQWPDWVAVGVTLQDDSAAP